MAGVHLQGLVDAVDAFLEEDADQYGHRRSVELMQRTIARLQARQSQMLAAFVESKEWADDGAFDAAMWLATVCRVPKGKAREQIATARRLNQAPRFAEAWLAGEVNGDHFGVVRRLLKPPTEDHFVRDEEELLRHAKTLRFEDFTRIVDYWRQHADPDGTEERELERQNRREVSLAASYEGMYLGRITLDPISGSIVFREHNRITEEFFQADWAEAKERLGHDPLVDDLRRTPAQRRADALVEMATRSATCPADGRRPAPLFSVFVGYETLHGRICELAEGIVLAPGSLLPWFDQAYVERAVFTPSGRVEVSAAARFFSGATRRAIELRDRRCTYEFCDVPLERCQCDHVVPFSEGGPTTQENGRLLCPFHNRRRNPRPPPAA
ncbi:MAG TPA: DUF222 domain-containing protein [Acidimicrobiales bacterium]|nr:DUF222 domain-containing protein [Acidimicrobiales bacterium]